MESTKSTHASAFEGTRNTRFERIRDEARHASIALKHDEQCTSNAQEITCIASVVGIDRHHA
jgi:hypothetical protein